MKTLFKLFLAFAIITGSVHFSNAQSSKKEKQAIKAAALRQMIDSSRYVFIANIAYPERGGERQLTSDYDLRVVKDSIIAFLPYFGRAYWGPDGPDVTEGGIKFTSTIFSYITKRLKNGNWEISIKPKDKNINDWRDVQQLTLNVTKDGYADLQVISTHRDPISFNGYIEAKD
jgi:hypothetical protein